MLHLMPEIGTAPKFSQDKTLLWSNVAITVCQMTDSKQTVGGRIKAARLKAKLTQDRLGQRCRMSADWICSIERGHRRAELATVMKLCHALKLKLEDVVGSPKHDHKPTKTRRPNGKGDDEGAE